MSDAPRRDATVLTILALASGAAGLVHELLYLRILGTALGEVFHVHTALVATFLLAMGVGAFLAHRLLPWLFAFELALGVHALVFPALVQGYQGSALDHLTADPLRQGILASVVLLAFPALCVGLSVPCFSAYLAPRLGGRAFTRVYTWFNLGAAASLLVVELGVVRWVGYHRSLQAIGALNILIGALLWAGRRRLAPAGGGDEASVSAPLERQQAGALFLASTWTGVFTAMFFKMAYALFYPGRENFAICTAALLLALVVGTRLVDARGWTFARCVSWGAALLALWVLLPAFGAAYRSLPAAFDLYGEPLARRLRGAAGETLIQLGWALLLGGSVYAPLAGTLPAMMRDARTPARRSGELLLLSGLGNATGLMLFVFLLHERLPYFSLAALVVGGLAFAAIAARPGPAGRDWIVLGVAAALVPLLLVLPESSVYTGFRPYADAEIKVFKSGSDDAVLVRYPDGSSRIHYNGLPEILVGAPGSVNTAEVTSGLLSALLAPRHERALVLGLGTGITAGATASVFRHTEVVEINRSVFQLASAVPFANFGLLDRPGVVLHHQDARRLLMEEGGRGGPYDLVVNTVSTPRFYAAGKVYTVELFDLVKRALAPDGVYSTWLTSGDLSPEGTMTLLATLASRFRHCALATLRRGYYVVVCSDAPLDRPVSAEGVEPAIAQGLASRVPLPLSLTRYLEAVLLTRDLFARAPFGSATVLNRDDFPILEFQVLKGSHAPWWDPISRDPRRFNIACGPEADVERFLDRAQVLAVVHPGLYRSCVEPVLAAQPELLKALQLRTSGGD